jgi:hypothetical protein
MAARALASHAVKLSVTLLDISFRRKGPSYAREAPRQSSAVGLHLHNLHFVVLVGRSASTPDSSRRGIEGGYWMAIANTI